MGFLLSSLIFSIIIRWDLSLIFLSANFLITITFLNGNQILFLDKNIISSILILLSYFIIIIIIQARNWYNLIKNWISTYLYNTIIIIMILFMCFYVKNFILFYFIFELVVIPTFLIILGWGYRTERIQAGTYLFIYTLIASLPFLIFLNFFYSNNNTLEFDNRFFIKDFIRSKYWWILIRLVFMVKIPIFLVHIWLPKAHVEAPVSGSIILAGILLKLGRYGFLKLFSIIISKYYNEFILLSIRSIGTFIIRLNCIRQNDLKCLVAYSSVAHINIIIISFLSISWLRIKRAIIIMIAHGLRSSAIFFILNIFYTSNKSRRIILIKRLIFSSRTLSFWWFLLCCLNISCPPSINFASEIIIILSIISYRFYFIILIVVILIVRGIYSILLFNIANHGRKIFSYNINLSCINDNLVLFCHTFFSFFLILIIFIL